MIAQVNGTTICYEQAGTGPDLLLLPGLGASTHVWYAQLKGLSPVMRVTAADVRGQGRSGRPAGPYSARLFAEDFAALLGTLDLGPAVVVGSSMSAAVAVELAAAHPERVSGLVLVGGFPSLSSEGKQRFDDRARLAETEGMEPLVDLVAAAALGATTHRTQPALVGLFRAVLLGNDPAAYAASCRAVRSIDVHARLPEVRCPTLVLMGSEEQVAPLPAARELARGIAGAELRVLPDAGHLPFLEQPAAFNAAVQEFVGSLEP